MKAKEVIPDYIDSSDEEKIDLRIFSGAVGMGSDLSGWNDIYLKEEIKKAVREVGYQYPSEVQKAAIPIIVQGKDLICQARSGMGKTAVFIIGILNQLSLIDGNYIPINCMVICHTRELAHQVFKDFRRFSRYFKSPDLRINCFFGGFPANSQRNLLQNKDQLPHIVIGTPGRLSLLIKEGYLPTDKVQYFVIDECDKVLNEPSMKQIVQKIFMKLKASKQVMMFSATLPQSIKKSAKNFMKNQQNIFVDEGKLILEGLNQFNVYLLEKQKLQILIGLLDKIKFNQGIIFVNTVQRAKQLTNILKQKLFNPICIHSSLKQQDRIINYDKFKDNKFRLLIATDLFGRGIDVERINLVINYDIPYDKDTYLHRVGRAGRFNTKGVAINFVCKITDQNQVLAQIKDEQIMNQIQEGLHRSILPLPQNFDSRLYI